MYVDPGLENKIINFLILVMNILVTSDNAFLLRKYTGKYVGGKGHDVCNLFINRFTNSKVIKGFWNKERDWHQWIPKETVLCDYSGATAEC